MQLNYKLLKDLPNLKNTIKQFDLVPNKKLGQNFILDQTITDQIVLQCGNLQDRIILEIGPGPGGLTRSLLSSNAKTIICIETDYKCITALQEIKKYSGDRLQIIQADALTIDESKFHQDKEMVIIANLPYNIGTALLIKWLSRPHLFESINIMLQKEVVDKILAEPGNNNYGRLSVICQWLCSVEKTFDLSPEFFFPPPKVHSSVIRLKPYKTLQFSCKQNFLEQITKAAFSQRRKIIKSNLKPIFGEQTEKALKCAGIDPLMRPEQISVEQYVRIAKLLE